MAKNEPTKTTSGKGCLSRLVESTKHGADKPTRCIFEWFACVKKLRPAL